MRQLLARMENTFAPGACAKGAISLAKITTIKTKTTR